MFDLGSAPARPRQAVIVPTYIRIVLRRARSHQSELVLVLHMRLQALGRLAAVTGGPATANDFAQNVFRRRQIVLDLDVLEQLVSEAELLGDEIHNFEIILHLEDRFYDLLVPL